MANDKISMPSSGGGILRYFEDYKSRVEIPPIYVVVIIAVIIVLEIVLYKMFWFLDNTMFK